MARTLGTLALALVALIVGFAAGRASVTPAPGVVVRGAPIVLGAMERSALDVEVGKRLDPIRAAYASALEADPQLAGDVVVKLNLGTDGQVTKARVKSSSLDCPTCEAAVLSVFSGLTPPPPERGTAIVTYPLHFFPG